MEELVFAFSTDEFWKLMTYKKKGLIKENSEVLKRIVQNGLFLRRNKLEKDPSFKQIIPYAIISNKESFYLFKRTSRQTEKRLHNKFSLGVGGHMNPKDSMESKEQYLIDELKRELFEEVKLLNGCLIEDIEFIGFINDDTISVGRVHIGLLYNIHVSNKEVYINETDKMTADWIDKSNLAEFYEGMETWTKIAFDFYIK
ncbi:MAG: DNA mismatch repair protein MutT [Bacteroidetes bacterium]|nr:MAG: DNA mismatch repair protein MutT [Bacteroidota bacterium]